MTDRDYIQRDVLAMMEDWDNTLCVSAETLRELVVSFNNGGVVTRHWNTAQQMLDALRDIFFIEVLPLREEHMRTYASLELNLAAKHRDPSDHVIISHAITNRLPLVSSDRKFEFYQRQGLQLIFNKK